MKSQAIWFDAARSVTILDEEVPAPGRGEVTFKALTSGISNGTEMVVYRGQAPSARSYLDLDQDRLKPEGQFERRFPIKYAYASVGEVVETGPDTTMQVGDRAFVRVPHERYYTVAESAAFPIPAWEPVETGTLMALMDVAVSNMMDYPVTVGEVAMISGLGVLGLLTAQLVKRTAGTVIAVDPIEARRALALELGADYAVAPSDALAAVAEASHGRGADVAMEISGTPAALQTAIEATGIEGTVLVPAYYGLKKAQLLLSPEFHMRRLNMISSSAVGIAGRLSHRWDVTRRLQVSAAFLDQMHPERLISHRVPFEDAASAYALIDNDPAAVLGVALMY